MRFQTALPLSMVQGTDFGARPLRLGRRRLRARRREPAEAKLVPMVEAPSDPSWGPLTRLGEQLRVQAKRGFRAAVVELQPGLYLVAEVPEASLRPEFGVVPLLAPLLTLAASRALKRRERREPEPEVVYEPPARWVDPEDLEIISGCGCRKCRGGR